MAYKADSLQEVMMPSRVMGLNCFIWDWITLKKKAGTQVFHRSVPLHCIVYMAPKMFRQSAPVSLGVLLRLDHQPLFGTGARAPPPKAWRDV